MRKVLYLFLTLALAVSSVCVPVVSAEQSAAAETAIVGADAAGYLAALGAGELEGVDLTAAVTRKEFAKIVCIIGGYSADNADEGFFIDVETPASAEEGEGLQEDYSGYINALAQAGIVSTGGWFEPDREITAEEAATMLVRVLGYTYRADEKGGYPAGYMLTAGNLGLFDNTGDVSAVVTKGAAAQMCANALDTDIMRKVIYGDTPEYKVERGYTLAYQVFGIIHLRDVVETVDLSALKGKNPTNPYYITVGGTSIYVNEFETQDYLGYSVDAYYRYDKNASRNSLIWISMSYYNDEIVIAIDDIKNIADGTIEYYNENQRVKTQSIGRLLPVIYNSTATGAAFNMDLIKDKEGRIRLLDNDGDGNTDIIFVDAYTDYVVGTIDKSGKKVYDGHDNTRSLGIDNSVNYPFTIIYNEYGEEINIGDIKIDSILSVFDYQEDADQGYLKIYVSDEVVTGVLTKIKESDGAVRVTVNDEEYVLTERCEAYCMNQLNAGSNVSLRLNHYGYVADIKSASDMQFGFLVAGKQEGNIGKWLKFRIYTESDTLIEVRAADRIGLNNNNYSSGDIKVLDSLISSSHAIYPKGPSDCCAQPIRFKLNSDGNLSYIDSIYTNEGIAATAADIDGDDALYKGSGGDMRYREGGYIFGGKFLARTTTVFMGCPSPETVTDYTNEEKYMTGTLKSFVGGNTYTVTPYFVTENSMVADYTIYDSEKAKAISELTYISVVKGVETYWENGEEYIQLTVIGQGGEKNILCKKDFTFARGTAASPEAEKLPATLKPSDLKKGDVIRYVTDMRGFVGNIILYYRIADNMSVTTAPTVFYSSFSLRCGYPLKKSTEGFSFLLTENMGDLLTMSDDMCDVIPNYANCSYVVYERNWRDGEDNVTTGSYDNIMSYEDTGIECTKIIVQTDVGTPRVIVIVK